MSPERFDRRLTTLVVLSAIMLVVIVMFAAVAIPLIVQGTSNTEAQKNSEAVTSCRAQYSSLVASASNEVQQAIATTFVDVLQPVETRDLNKIAEDTKLIQATQKVYDAATDTYRAALRLATESPDDFLEHCRTNPPS